MLEFLFNKQHFRPKHPILRFAVNDTKRQDIIKNRPIIRPVNYVAAHIGVEILLFKHFL